MVWFEIYVDDMERARNFYETMLDIRLEALPSPDPDLEMYSFPMVEGKVGACGALVKMEGCKAGGAGTIVYFCCEDCEEDEARAAAIGAHILKPKFAIGDYGFITLLQDSEGNVVGLHSIK